MRKRIFVERWIPRGSKVYILNNKKEWEEFYSIGEEASGECPEFDSNGLIIDLQGCKLSVDDLPDEKIKVKEKDKVKPGHCKAWAVTPYLKEYIYKDGRTARVPFQYLLNDPDMELFGTFIIKRPAYANKLDLICQHLNYFIEFYDKDNELLFGYLKLKHIINNKQGYEIHPSTFKSMLYSILFSNSMLDKIASFVDDNYILNIDEEDGNKKFSDQTRFTDKHVKILYRASTATKMIIIPLIYYIYVNGHDQNYYIHQYVKPIFNLVSEPNVDILRKFNIWIAQYVEVNVNKNSSIWSKLEAYGENPVQAASNLLNKHIITDSLYKYRFNDNPVKLNYVIIKEQIGYMNIDKFNHNVIDITPQKGSTSNNDLTKLDKLLQSSAKIDESTIVITEASIKRNMQKVLNKMGATIDEKEINFYMAFHHINPKIQRRLVNDFFAKEFSGHNDLKNVTKRQYITLMVCLKKYLLGLGYIYLPMIISSNVLGKTNSRMIQNNKFKDKLENTPMYNIMNSEKFSILNKVYENDRNKDPKLQLLSLILNSKFTYVDYDMGIDKMDEIIEYNEDALCSEFINFYSMV